ncbi:MAG: hypothetical protein HPZ91_16620 [Lentisphaeria bacterium]|nr:hypothetical protein [Lentisphaeria bacterium]
MNQLVRHQTVKLISKLIHPLTESNLISVPEYREIMAQLKHLAEKGTPLPVVVPRLIDQTAAAEMLGISLANFKRLEREGYFPFKRKMVGTSVRYRNTDLVHFMMNESAGNEPNGNLTAVY